MYHYSLFIFDITTESSLVDPTYTFTDLSNNDRLTRQGPRPLYALNKGNIALETFSKGKAEDLSTILVQLLATFHLN